MLTGLILISGRWINPDVKDTYIRCTHLVREGCSARHSAAPSIWFTFACACVMLVSYNFFMGSIKLAEVWLLAVRPWVFLSVWWMIFLLLFFFVLYCSLCIFFHGFLSHCTAFYTSCVYCMSMKTCTGEAERGWGQFGCVSLSPSICLVAPASFPFPRQALHVRAWVCACCFSHRMKLVLPVEYCPTSKTMGLLSKSASSRAGEWNSWNL